ncbi:MAG: membrane protein insertase YidC [Spirochaetales bacterium]|nr:membrane protein insertase YidC [Spirochaetales bacterium]MCF7939871.1 membrane protein insertase YidC [Spirochaetales bacterium]
MDKQTVIAVVLSVIVITVGFMIQGALFPPEEQAVQQSQTAEGAQTGTAADGSQGSQGTQTDRTGQTSGTTADQGQAAAEGTERTAPAYQGPVKPVAAQGLTERTISTDDFPEKLALMEVIFTTRGGDVTSIRLKDHVDEGEPVEMVKNYDTDYNAFTIHFGDHEVPAVNALFDFRRVDQHTYEFTRDFAVSSGGREIPFTLKKTYSFVPDEYMFEVEISIENSVNEYPPLDFNGIAYTLGYGPQIGPSFDDLSGGLGPQGEYRKYITYDGDDKEEHKADKEGTITLEQRFNWSALASKYFTVIAIPDATPYDLTFSTLPKQGVKSVSEMYLSRPLIKSSRNTDTFRFYVGSKETNVLQMYNDERKNSFGLRDMEMEEVVDTRRLLGWMQNILKFLLETYYGLIPNYGVAIILLTITIKIILFPLTRKTYESTSRMQGLQPKIQELREKYKDNPQKMNKELGALYKREGVNPLGGCLPMVFQIPVFIALYGLLTTHFKLRGADFLAPWITDLSAPESIIDFQGFTVPLLGWEALRLLPFLFVGTQLLMTKFTQNPSSGSQGQMKFMTYGLPLIFFFILYNMPSGLLLYWTGTNLFTAVQQMVTNKLKEKRKQQGGEEK